MPKVIANDSRKLVWVTDIENIHAPKLSELTGTGSLELEMRISTSNYKLGATGNASISDPPLGSAIDVSVPGAATYEASIEAYRNTNKTTDTTDAADDDQAWNTFTDRGIHGYLVERIGPAHDVPWAAQDEVRVFEAITGDPQVVDPSGKNGLEKFTVTFFVQDADERATVAAGA